MASKDRNLTVNLVGDAKKLQNTFSGLGGKLNTKAKAGLAALGTAAVAAFKIGVEGAFKREDVAAQFEASLGETPERAKELGEIASGLWKEAWGDSLGEVGAAVEAVVSTFEGLGLADIEDVSRNALAFADIFNVDVADAVNAAGILLK